MRTTLDIEDSVLAAAKELARQRNVPTGQLVSQLLRKALIGQSEQLGAPTGQPESVAGFRPFAGREIVTNELVDRLRDGEGV